MYKLDTGFYPESKLWRGCKLTPKKSGRHWLEMSKDSAIKFLEANLVELLPTIPKADRDQLIITGGVPQWVIATVTRVFASAFEKLSIYDPNDGTTIEIPNPPADTESAPD